MAKRNTKVVFDSWDTYVAEANEKPLFISFDADAAANDLTDTLQQCARVVIPIHEPNQNGGPADEESERLYAMEDALCAILTKHAVVCRLVGRLTHDGTREIVFQLDDWESFRPPVGLWMQENDDYEIDVSEHEGWTFFDDCIRPTPEIWMQLADQRVIQGLLEAGSDPSKPHALEFVFTGDEQSLRQVAQKLRAQGYAPAPADAPGQIIMVKKMLLDEDEIIAESRANRALADEHEVEYDGWGAEVVQ